MIIKVYNKKGIFDAEGENIKKDIEATGINVKEVRVIKLYDMEGLPMSALKKVAKEILTDPITQEYQLERRFRNERGCSVVDVWLKPAVTDTVAETIIKAVKDIGIRSNNLKVKTGIRYKLIPKLPHEKLEYIANRILSNVIINYYHIH